MVRRHPSGENITISLYLKNGDAFVDKDITNSPFGNAERQVSFWLNETTIRSYPMSEVSYIELKFNQA